MAANKVVFGNKVLIDLTGDTVTEEALLKGYTAHKADGTIITGTAFAGYPNEFVFLDNIEDSSGNPIKDSSGKTIQGQTIYRKARNSVLLDSTGDIIEDGFEQQIEVVKFVWVSFISRLFLHLNPLGTVNAGQFVSMIDTNRVGLYGLTYKENVDDMRESPTLQLLESQERHLATGLKVYDPFITKEVVSNQYYDLDSFLENIDMVVIMVKHDEIKENLNKLSNKVVLDCHNIIKLPGVYHI